MSRPYTNSRPRRDNIHPLIRHSILVQGQHARLFPPPRGFPVSVPVTFPNANLTRSGAIGAWIKNVQPNESDSTEQGVADLHL